MISDSPLNAPANKYKRSAVNAEFPMSAGASNSRNLVLWQFIASRPQRFYSRDAFALMSSFLAHMFAAGDASIRAALGDAQTELAVAFDALQKINALEWHDISLPSEPLELTQLVHSSVNPSYLHLVEAVYANLILPIAVHCRIQRGKATAGLDTYNRHEELCNSEWRDLGQACVHVVRNGIAHGSVRFRHDQATYRDKKGNSRALGLREVVELHDTLLDICNGMAAAVLTCLLAHAKSLETLGIVVPAPALLLALQEEVRSAGWHVEGCLESETFAGDNQLTVFVNAGYRDPLKVAYECVRTAAVAVELASGFDQYFFRLRSKFSLLAWARFSGEKLRAAAALRPDDLAAYTSALDGDGVFFAPPFGLPRVAYKIGTLWAVLTFNWRFLLAEHRHGNASPAIVPRLTELHRLSWKTKVNASVVLDVEPGCKYDHREFVKRNIRRIIRIAVRAARRDASSFAVEKCAPLSFARVLVFTRDFRVRRLQGSGLIPELLCVIEYRWMSAVRIVDIAGGKPEQQGRYRIVWNCHAP